ncbi:hypothetical protein F511_02301 [Dorcoceras hygrometricum]|uniref:Vesicle transport v-SNARE N-terminal domain-containing protein n=1 Tax=Dorcoceras hygrometricum TaxID=472368 RepID=A0A2Z7CF09_9LAMI|nr:hypothetical protein F511_02301 [Dorcoceras hygrometricum]
MDSSLIVFLSTMFAPLALSLSVFVVLRATARRKLRLPPGNLGLPILGETLQLISAYKTENPEPFIDDRVARYGAVFTTHVFGEPTVFSADPETNRFILQNEGRLFESSYPGSIQNLLGRHSLLLMRGSLHKRMHSLTMSFANSAIMRDHLLVDIDRLVRFNMDSWTGRVILMEETKKARRKVAEALSLVVRERRRESEKGERKKDMLAALLDEGGGGSGGTFSDEEIVDFMLALLVAGYETTSTIMTLAVKFLTETPHALAQLKIRKMDLEARGFQPNVKAVLLAKLREFKSDLNNLKNEVKRIASTNLNQAARDELLEAGMADTLTATANQRERLVVSTEKLDNSSNRIRDSRRVMLETEELGVSLLQDLHGQRQALLRADDTVYGVDDNISKSKKIMTNISRRMDRNKWVIGAIVAVLVIAVALVLYFKLK